MISLSFKRAKKVVALHYGSYTFSTRKLCSLFPHDGVTDKSEAIRAEAVRIIELRTSLGYETTSGGIDSTWRVEADRQKRAHTGRRPKKQPVCVTCKQPVDSNGWAVKSSNLHACSGDCSLIASFYYLSNGTKNTPCISFKKMHGRSIEELKPDESLDTMLAYMVHLMASRKKREIKNARLNNPTDCLIQAD